ncbi:HET-domain-containing [Fusarium albosuccineum]|uniref:HET-domain-containing n=1 Tax=Fusarium albosuccineum TaxID=1237068 RepID=A0A8H4KDG9_9HYPO|nr:HET-domain-containing [Fusarium albosuccineum]
MRLLNTKTLRLCYFGEQPPRYAALSHTWEEEEVTFRDIQQLDTASRLKGFEKIQGCCRQALAHGYDWVWIDTCCIDKTSSSELSEAINCMYKWGMSRYIAVLKNKPPSGEDRARFGQLHMMKSRWFTRGWTLQELIAPPFVEFYSKVWTGLGTRSSLEVLLTLRTRIPLDVLGGKLPSTYCVSQRMSWASGRTTTREEDLAYCLFGLFGVNMPLLYGEGRKAFIGLQEEVLRRTEDLSLLVRADTPGTESAYGYRFTDPGVSGVFAPHPSCFNLDGKVTIGQKPPPDYEFSDIQTTWQNQTHMQLETEGQVSMLAVHVLSNLFTQKARKPVIMERHKRFVVFCLDLGAIQSFEPRKVCLSIVSGDLNSESSASHLSMARHMSIRVLDLHHQRSLSITASPVTQVRCTENTDGYDIELPIDTAAFGSFNLLFNPWNSVRVLGVSRVSVKCLQLDYDEVYDEGSKEQEPGVPSTFETLLYAGWGVCDEIQRLYCTLAPTTKSEFAIQLTERSSQTGSMHDWSAVTW